MFLHMEGYGFQLIYYSNYTDSDRETKYKTFFSCKNPIRKFESKIITSITEEIKKSKTNFFNKVFLFSKNEKLKNNFINFIISKKIC
jgi:hypothetical protein